MIAVRPWNFTRYSVTRLVYEENLNLDYWNNQIFIITTGTGEGESDQEGFDTNLFVTVSIDAYSNADLVNIRKFDAHSGDYSFLKICVRILEIIVKISRNSQKAQS